MKRIEGIGVEYEVGDTVKIKSRDWYFLSRLQGESYVKSYNGPDFTSNHAQFCGQTAKITYINNGKNAFNCRACKIDLDKGAYFWDIDSFCEIFALEQMEAIENGRD